jgi:hypothetical protein
MITDAAFFTKRTDFFVINKIYTFAGIIFRAGNSFSVSFAKTAFTASVASSAFAAYITDRTGLLIISCRSLFHFRIATDKKHAANQQY